MGEPKFEILKKLVFDYYAKCNYEKALDVAVIASENFPEKVVQTSYWLICLHSRLGQRDKAMAILGRCIENQIWWSARKLMEDEDLFPIQGEVGFQGIIEKCRRMEAEARRKSKPGLFLQLPKGYSSENTYPLLVSLHWQNGNIADYSPPWKSHPLADGMIMAFPQSSQISAVNEYSWDDETQGEKEVIQSLQGLIEKYSVDMERIILAGASQGARLAIKMALEAKDYSVKGFIAVIPTIDRIDSLVALGRLAAKGGLRGSIIAGEQDPYFPWAASLHRALKYSRIPCKLIKVNTLGHHFPPDFSKHLRTAIDFILKS